MVPRKLPQGDLPSLVMHTQIDCDFSNIQPWTCGGSVAAHAVLVPGNLNRLMSYALEVLARLFLKSPHRGSVA